MPLLTPDWDPSRRQLRHFAWTAALILAVLTLRPHHPLTDLGLRLAAGAVFAVGAVLPGAFRGPYLALAVLTWPVGWVVGHVLLGLVYFGLVTPLALAFRLWGRDALRRRIEPEADSYWQPRRPVTDKRRYYRPF